MTGRIAEYANTSNQPIIVTSDDQQHVMVVMVGTNDGALLAYWKQRQWVRTRWRQAGRVDGVRPGRAVWRYSRSR